MPQDFNFQHHRWQNPKSQTLQTRPSAFGLWECSFVYEYWNLWVIYIYIYIYIGCVFRTQVITMVYRFWKIQRGARLKCLKNTCRESVYGWRARAERQHCADNEQTHGSTLRQKFHKETTDKNRDVQSELWAFRGADDGCLGMRRSAVSKRCHSSTVMMEAAGSMKQDALETCSKVPRIHTLRNR
jgi:hypothetical protein